MSVVKFPVSVKGVIVHNNKVLLLENERNELELPGGKLEPGEEPFECVSREIWEETSLNVETGPLIDCWLYRVLGKEIVIISYGCILLDAEPVIQISCEHKHGDFFDIHDVDSLLMPNGYKQSIKRWRALINGRSKAITCSMPRNER